AVDDHVAVLPVARGVGPHHAEPAVSRPTGCRGKVVRTPSTAGRADGRLGPRLPLPSRFGGGAARGRSGDSGGLISWRGVRCAGAPEGIAGEGGGHGRTEERAGARYLGLDHVLGAD